MIKIYGGSDDLIEIEGDLTEEFNIGAGDQQPKLLAFSDGTLLRIVYGDEGIWRITPLVRGSAVYTKEFEATDADGEYSDVVTLDGDIQWVALASSWAKP